MSFFTAYCDESYTKAGAAYLDQPYIIAGYIAPTKTWKKFDAEWKRLLHGEQLPYFHMADCEGGYTDLFGHLDLRTPTGRAERDRLQRVFIGAINRFEIYGVAAGIPLSHFCQIRDALTKYVVVGSGESKEFLTPYLFAFQGCLSAVLRRLKGHEEKEVAFIFDRQNEFEARAQRARTTLVNDPNYRHAGRLGPLTYCDKKEALALQAADILAYEVMREMRDPSLKRWQRELLDKRRPVVVEYMTEEMIADLVSKIHARAGEQDLTQAGTRSA
jgi:hypothetical protein